MPQHQENNWSQSARDKCALSINSSETLLQIKILSPEYKQRH